MWQRLTDRARSAVLSAHEEARRLGEGSVGTEHLLLGLVREDNLPNLGVGVLIRLGATPERIQGELAPWLTHGDNLSGEEMQLTPQSKRVIDLAQPRGVLVCPGNWSTGVLGAATVHLAAYSPITPVFEYVAAEVYWSPLRRAIAEVSLPVVDGAIALPTAPGIGVELPADLLAHFRVG